MIVSTAAAQRRALFILALTLLLGASRFITETWAAGAFAVVLEIVAADAARQITSRLKIPTIGIGSGPHCDGQILVTHDLIGLFPWFTPKFVSPEARVAEEIRKATRAFIYRTRGGVNAS